MLLSLLLLMQQLLSGTRLRTRTNSRLAVFPPDSFAVQRRDVGADTFISLNADFPFKAKIKIDSVSLELSCEPYKMSGSLRLRVQHRDEESHPCERTVQSRAAWGRRRSPNHRGHRFRREQDSLDHGTYGEVPVARRHHHTWQHPQSGPSVLKVEYGLKLSGQMAIAVGTGAVATIPDSALLRVDLLNPSKNKVTP